jgi:CelD/BcsL family acetyltransferase involved in cellulose biosynthesis
MRSGRLLHWWFPSYDPEYQKYSPGMIVLFQTVEAISAAGIQCIDLGKGDEPYKRSVATGSIELGEGFVEHRSLMASVCSLRRLADTHLPRQGIGAFLRLPLRAWRRLEWRRQYY